MDQFLSGRELADKVVQYFSDWRRRLGAEVGDYSVDVFNDTLRNFSSEDLPDRLPVLSADDPLENHFQKEIRVLLNDDGLIALRFFDCFFRLAPVQTRRDLVETFFASGGGSNDPAAFFHRQLRGVIQFAKHGGRHVMLGFGLFLARERRRLQDRASSSAGEGTSPRRPDLAEALPYFETFLCPEGYLLVRFVQALAFRFAGDTRNFLAVARPNFLREYDWWMDASSGRFMYDLWDSLAWGVRGEDLLVGVVLVDHTQDVVVARNSLQNVTGGYNPEQELSLLEHDQRYFHRYEEYVGGGVEVTLPTSVRRGCSHDQPRRIFSERFCDDELQCFCGDLHRGRKRAEIPWEIRFEFLWRAEEPPTGPVMREFLLADDARTSLHARVKNLSVAVVGSHGATNLDMLWSVLAGLHSSHDDHPAPGPRPFEEEEGDTLLSHAALRAVLTEGTSSSTREESQAIRVDARHFFTYLWQLEGTQGVGELRVEASWRDFFGEDLDSGSRSEVVPFYDRYAWRDYVVDTSRRGGEGDAPAGRAEGGPLSALLYLESALGTFFSENEFFKRAELVLGCEPFWLCLPLLWLFPAKRLFLRVGMCPAMAAERFLSSPGATATAGDYVGTKELEMFFGLFRRALRLYDNCSRPNGNFGKQESSSSTFSSSCDRIVLATNSRWGGETFLHNYGRRLPYVPPLGLHARFSGNVSSRAALSDGTEEDAPFLRDMFSAARELAYSGHTKNEILVFRTRLPLKTFTFDAVLARIIDKGARPSNGGDICIVYPTANLPYKEFAESFLAVVLLPHIPQALRLSDLTALSIPMLVPALPMLLRMMWPFAGPYCGRSGGDCLAQRRDPQLRPLGGESGGRSSWEQEGTGFPRKRTHT